jgi:lysyl-tRNA synthetase class 1
MSEHRAFWADDLADEILAREPADPIVVKGGVSPSGVPHVGHANEILRGYFVAEALRDRGREVRQVFTSDDADPLRSVPRRLMSLDGRVVGLDEVDAGALGRNLGRPLADVPDPFGCCDSFGAHQTALLAESADLLDVPVEFVSTATLYADGDLEPATRTALERREELREVLADYQDKVDESYVPFRPRCENCGQLSEGVVSVDLAAGTVDYECTDFVAGNRTIEGCGHRGTATLREGKLPWRVEWPAQWGALDVDFEPFGKDHAEGSWESAQDVAALLGVDPPVPMVYEWFTVDGEPLSSSSGNVLTVREVLEFLEPEVFAYFFVKNPRKARDFDVENVDDLVDEFDRFERAYFGEADDESALAERAYPMLFPDRESVPTEAPVRIPYRFAAVLGMTEDPSIRADVARTEGHLPEEAPEPVVERALARVDLAREWARRTDNEYAYELKRATMPAVEFDPEVERALEDLAAFVAEGHDGEAIQGEIYETAKRHDLAVGEFFAAGYRLFFDDEEGPRLGEFLAKLDREFVVDRLRRER